MCLFACAEDRDEVESVLAQKEVSGVTEIRSVKERSISIKRCDHARRAADFFVLIASSYNDVFGVHEHMVVSLCSKLAYDITQSS
jgi:hypothetical protein